MKVKTIIIKKTDNNKEVIFPMRSFADDSFPEAELYYNNVKKLEKTEESVIVTMIESDLYIKSR